MLTPLTIHNISPSTPPSPSTPLAKRRKVDVPYQDSFPSFDEEPHSSPRKIGELGLHVQLSPKNDKRTERQTSVAQALPFTKSDFRPEPKEEDQDELEYWDRPRESVYVTAFNTAVDTVIEREGHLFSEEEMNIINTYRNLPCTQL